MRRPNAAQWDDMTQGERDRTTYVELVANVG